MIIKDIELKWSHNNKNFYELKGYTFTMYGEKFLLKDINDISSNSSFKLEVICDECGITFERNISIMKKTRIKYEKDICKICITRQEITKMNVKEATKKAMLEKYGVDNCFRLPEIKRKAVETSKKNGSYITRIEKSKETKEDRYGNKNYNNRTKYKETCLNRYGIESTNQVEFIKKKQKDTKIEKGSINNPNNIKLTEIKKYRKVVSRLSEVSYSKYVKDIDDDRGYATNHIDHIYSILDGFNNSIHPFIIAHPCNIRIINYKDNLIKSGFSEIDFDQLIQNIKYFNIMNNVTFLNIFNLQNETSYLIKYPISILIENIESESKIYENN